MEFTPVDKKRYKFLLLQTFKAFVKFCKDNGIQFFAAGGTMIGAVRHRGFIPWDDDIDVYMKRCDYDKFINLRSQLDGTNYEILDPSLDGYYCAHTKFSHRYSTLWEFQGIPFVSSKVMDDALFLAWSWYKARDKDFNISYTPSIAKVQYSCLLVRIIILIKKLRNFFCMGVSRSRYGMYFKN